MKHIDSVPQAMYSLCTEYLEWQAFDVHDVIQGEGFSCFAIVVGTGYWNNKLEQSQRIDIVANDNEVTEERMRVLAVKLRELLKQECILVLRQPVHANFV